MSSYSSITGHASMIYDEVRNSAYAAALKRYVTPESIVLDLGSGLGIHGLIAAAQGARHVYLVDPSPVNIVAAAVAAENGLADRVTCIQNKIEQAELPEKVDLVVSVFTGNFLLEEDLLPSLFHARDRFLKPSGVMLPDFAEMQAVPVCADEYYRKCVEQWSEKSQGIGFSSVRKYAANTLNYDSVRNRVAEFLARPATLMNLDFATAIKAECSSEVNFQVSQSGDCHGFLGWFRMRLGDQWISTSPEEPPMHWSQVFLPLDPPLQVAKGDNISFRLLRPQNGEWTWTCVYGAETQRHSTFYSRALSVKNLRHRARNIPIKMSVRVELACFVLSQMNGINSVDKIQQLAADKFKGKFYSVDELNRQVESVVASCSD